ncbi:thioredoxin [Pontibacillus halophilus JSM 076056 = DSM 19796]|uniref:Thioredoxin n=1 Tax=Pontibacillus halophilus JSM 076056 = DSM 19796 TaxID=1385510 RepID=A0A0A5GNJ9_9BACI|nr:thioredoxin family protein [Pontibacillus halophilus]KGX92828.1 thioredoxin [Pontibacillus halophilus JSM 076056 = DSM 19796]
MIPIEQLEQLDTPSPYTFLYIYTPFCGTCKLARKMLDTVEQTLEGATIHEMNASLFPDFMQIYKVESVPCLLILNGEKVEERIYAFQSVPYLYETILHYR